MQHWPGADLLGIEDIEGIEIGVGIAAEMEEDIEIFEWFSNTVKQSYYVQLE